MNLTIDVWGAIEYKGEGVFIAGGAGIPFIAILSNYKLTQNQTTN
jgi:predicted ferric reductase